MEATPLARQPVPTGAPVCKTLQAARPTACALRSTRDRPVPLLPKARYGLSIYHPSFLVLLACLLVQSHTLSSPFTRPSQELLLRVEAATPAPARQPVRTVGPAHPTPPAGPPTAYAHLSTRDHSALLSHKVCAHFSALTPTKLKTELRASFSSRPPEQVENRAKGHRGAC